MSTLLFILVLGALYAGYVFYAKFLERVFDIDPKRITPAHTSYDGIDYVPAKNWLVIFGHHFASIAGAGPIIGPVLGYMWWGWLGALIWIVLGTVFIGAVHDFSSLVISVREKGSSIGQIAEKYISRRAGLFFLVFLWFSLILVIAVFAAICAKSFIAEPQVVVSSLGLIPVAILVGFLVYRLRVNLFVATILGIVCLGALVFIGEQYPVTLKAGNPYLAWVVYLFIYAFCASIIPVNILLQPRDYLSSFLLFFGIGVALIGIITRPFSLAGAKLIEFNSQAGFLFPIMFITIACGAISGFHSLVASGTTSKQLANERDARRVAYGGMVLEAVLATIVLFAVAFGLKNIPSGVKEPTQIFSLGFAAVGYVLGDYAPFVALVILNAFILTTLDTATRIARFLTQELCGISNKWLATSLVVVAAAYLALMNKWQILWPIFGASNQLVAGLALVVASSWLLSKGRRYLFALIPAVIMIGITVAALGLKIVDFFQKKDYTLTILSGVLILFGVLGIFEFRRLYRCRKEQKVS
jgi:carbon starvation protein